MNRTADAIVCGAGIVGIACAWHLAARAGLRRVAIVDERPPLSLTSDKSTECYRNWWPGPGDAMVSLMNRSVDLLEALAEASGNRFHLNRRGYLFATADPGRVATFEAAGREAESLGAGPLRRHDGRGGSDYVPHRESGYADAPDGADLIVDDALIRRHFPWLAPETVAVLHARRCGWLSAQQLGTYLLEEARRHGAFLVTGRVEEVLTAGGNVSGARVAAADGGSGRIAAPVFVNRGRAVREAGGGLARRGPPGPVRTPRQDVLSRIANGRSLGTPRSSSGRIRSGFPGRRRSTRPSPRTRKGEASSRRFPPGRTGARTAGRMPTPSSSTGRMKGRNEASPSSPSTGTRAIPRSSCAACRA